MFQMKDGKGEERKWKQTRERKGSKPLDAPIRSKKKNEGRN